MAASAAALSPGGRSRGGHLPPPGEVLETTGPSLIFRHQLRAGCPPTGQAAIQVIHSKVKDLKPLSQGGDFGCAQGMRRTLAAIYLMHMHKCYQAFAYNPHEQQILSVDVEGGQRLWSLKGELLYRPWVHDRAAGNKNQRDRHR